MSEARRLSANLLENPRWFMAFLSAIFVLCIVMNWLRLGSFWGDAPRSLFELYRASRGEVPYRDFSWPYPPFAVVFCALIFRSFGATFHVAQLILDFLSICCVLAVWGIARRLASPVHALVATVAFTLVGATNGGNFALFSLTLYTPSILTGSIGIILVFIGLIDYYRTGLRLPTCLILVFGGLVSCLSRPECVAAIVMALSCIAVIKLRVSRTGQFTTGCIEILKIVALTLAPSGIVYLLIALSIGYRPLIDGMTAYGMAGIVCPWWPTGFGFLSAVAAVSGAAAIFGVLECVGRWSAGLVPARFTTRHFLLCLAALYWVLFHVIFFKDLTVSQSIQGGALGIAYFLVSANTALTPIMWACCIVFTVESLRCLRSRSIGLSSEEALLYLLVTGVFGLSVRTLFNNALTDGTVVTPVLYALLFPLIPALARHASQRWSARELRASPVFARRVEVLVSLALLLFGSVRLIGFGVREGRKKYVTIETDGGPVKLSDGISADVYQFLKKNTSPGEQIADVAYGGGLNFALQRTSPLYTTQFINFRPSVEQRQRDYLQLRASRTRFVISQEPPLVRYGTGLTCTFPRCEWKANERQPDSVTFPVAQFIEAQYRPAVRFQGVSIYRYDPGRTAGRPSR